MSSNKTNNGADAASQDETLVATHEDTVTIDLPMTFLRANEGQGKPLVILLHGYEDTARAFLRRAFPEILSDYEILAPNGIFPMPRRIEMGWRAAFAWYFAEHKRPAVIPPSVPVQALVQLIEKLGLKDRPKVVVGFSQGGFLMPRVLPQLQNLKRAIGIGCMFRTEDYPMAIPCPVDGIHGNLDEIISVDKGQASFAELSPRNPEGQFFVVQDLKHTMNDEARTVFRSRLEEAFS